MIKVAINGVFRWQEVTGQQRFATEITNSLLSSQWEGIAFRLLECPGFIGRSKLMSWAWVQLIPLMLKKNEISLSLTNKSPIWCATKNRHVVHDLFPIEHPEWYGRKFGYVHSFALKRILMMARSTLFVVSPAVAEGSATYVPNSAVVEVIPNAPSEAFFSRPDLSAELSVLNKFGLSSGEYFMLPNKYDPRKNTQIVNDVISEIRTLLTPDLRFISFGSGSQNLGLVDEQELILSLGRISDFDLAVLYRNAVCYISPSINEGFGLPLVEALAAGGNLIISDIPIHRWVVERANGSAEYFQPGNQAELKNKILNSYQFRTAEQFSNSRLGFSWAESATTLANRLRNENLD